MLMIVRSTNAYLDKQCSAVEARRAHNPEVTRSKRVTANFFSRLEEGKIPTMNSLLPHDCQSLIGTPNVLILEYQIE